MTLEKASPCKVNLLLNVLGKRRDGFHELETVMYPIPVFDRLRFERGTSGIQLTCTEPALPTDSTNLVYRAAACFVEAAKIGDGVRLHLEKVIPLAAGLGGGSANAATTLLGLNELFGQPLSRGPLHTLGADLGSDVPFFLQTQPALATGRGEQIHPLGSFPALHGTGLVLVHPGFGVPTAWAYQNLARFPDALNGRTGRAPQLIAALKAERLKDAAAELYNSLEAPVLQKYPLLGLFQEFMRANGALAALMSGSGSSTFALTPTLPDAEALADKFQARFGSTNWIRVVQL